MSTNVFIVEDENIVALDLEHRLLSMGFSVVGQAGTGEQAIDLIADLRPNVVLMDIQLRGELDGIHTAERVQKELDVPVIFLTAYSDNDSLKRVKESQAYGYLLKPFQEREVAIAIELALYKHRAERELRQSRALLDATINNIDEGVITAAADRRVILMNEAASRLTGWPLEEALGRPIDDIVRTEPIDGPESAAGWMSLVDRAGARRAVSMNRTPLEHGGFAAGSEVLVIRDVSADLEHNRRLLEAKAAAESAARAKTDFLARVTHELRTPLNSILGMTGLVRDEIAGAELADHLAILESSAGSLSDLIGDILDFNRLDGDREVLREDLFDPVDMVERTVRSHAVEAQDGGLRLIAVIDPRASRQVYGDESRTAQVLRNLISNAIKFTDHGYVAVTLSPAADGGIELSIEDTGRGIPPERVDRIFEPFTQVDELATRDAGGVGLGLSIVRRLTQRMGGTVTVDSTPGRGSVFRVVLPFNVATPEPAEPARAPVEHSAGLVTDDPLLYRVFAPWCAHRGIPLRREVPLAETHGTGEIPVTTGGEAASPEGAVLVRPLRQFRATQPLPGQRVFAEPLTVADIEAVIPGRAGGSERSDLTRGDSSGRIPGGSGSGPAGKPPRYIDSGAESDDAASAFAAAQSRLQAGDNEGATERLRHLRSVTKDGEAAEAAFRAMLAARRGDTDAAVAIIEEWQKEQES